ncbi:hypothetical protein ACJJTC_012075 [Scirpophaga incertulas]
MMRRGKALLESSRQGSVDGGGTVSSDKELVHKCHSDPGGGRALGAVPRAYRHRSASGAPKKCVLTLDGYSWSKIDLKVNVKNSNEIFDRDGEFSVIACERFNTVCSNKTHRIQQSELKSLNRHRPGGLPQIVVKSQINDLRFDNRSSLHGRLNL